MYRFQLPPTADPDVVLVLDASHAESLMQASSSALRIMEAEGRAQSALGIVKSSAAFLIGRMDFATMTITEPAMIDDFSSKLMLSDLRASILLLRNQLNGNIRIAMNNALAALEARALHLIFLKGGPLFILSPKNPNGLYRLALLRVQGATCMSEEKCCVTVNRASKMAYRELWTMLSKHVNDRQEAVLAGTKDVLDEAEEQAEMGLTVAPRTRMYDAEDAIDNLVNEVNVDRENPTGLSNPLNTAPPPKSPESPSAPANNPFDIDNTDGLDF